jgi:transposase
MVNFKDVKKGDYLEIAAYSIDLRQKILSAWPNKEGTQRELAKRFKVSLSFIPDFLRRYRETAQIAARTQGGIAARSLKVKSKNC